MTFWLKVGDPWYKVPIVFRWPIPWVKIFKLSAFCLYDLALIQLKVEIRIFILSLQFKQLSTKSNEILQRARNICRVISRSITPRGFLHFICKPPFSLYDLSISSMTVLLFGIMQHFSRSRTNSSSLNNIWAMPNVATVFIYLILSLTQEYFTYASLANNMV